jgi:hypothetical protein
MGGASAIENVASVEIELEIEEAAFTVTATYRATRDGRMRTDVFDDDQRVFAEAYDGESGRQFVPGDSTADAMSPDGEAAVKSGIVGHIFGLHERPALSCEISLRGRAIINGIG